MSASTFATTGGGSSSLNSSKLFTIATRNGVLVMKRMAPGRAGKIRAVYAENPRAALAQGDSVPEKAWEKAALASIATKLPANIGKALALQSVPDVAVDS